MKSGVLRLYSILLLGFLAAGCHTTTTGSQQNLPTDEVIREKIVGTWIPTSNPNYPFIFLSNGAFTAPYHSNRDTTLWTASGTWQVDQGIVDITTTNVCKETTNYPVADLEHFTIQRIDNKKLIYSSGNQTTVLKRKAN